MKKPNLKEIGMRIREQREQLRYTREQLAEKLDVSSKFISDIELGVKGVSLKTLVNLSTILDMNVKQNASVV
ncbi:helix-turn-helix transcriptional regulator [Ruminococcus sp. HUN007]|uniref:helix-turn-helix domain-containing protein n=1 Tax=Ruminococcus sp. HUN007 TaxID=1514668 RepID=UPI0005D2A77A|nr:helix-turn-helix transcriptional regulator [Ruminococcus sp. HUN007]